jgi:hypothetical protein
VIGTGWWYLSFADEEQFRGCCIVMAADLNEAVRESMLQDCNAGPDMSVEGAPIVEPERLPPWNFRNRLLTKEQMERWQPRFPA